VDVPAGDLVSRWHISMLCYYLDDMLTSVTLWT